MVIQSERVWMAGQFVPLQLEIQSGVIQAVLPYGEKEADEDYGSYRIVPGFIDVHTHGAYGFDTNDGEPEGLRNWIKRVPEEGVTSLLPTTVTQMPDVLTAALKNVAEVMEDVEKDSFYFMNSDGYEGAEILGIHFEGPYLDMDYKGAQPPEAIAPPSVAQFQEYQKAAKGMIRYITLAPEHDEGLSLTKYCGKAGVVVSLGHSSATYDQALLAVANGASSMTHVYNGMTPFSHRAPGLVGAALRIRDIYGEIICDGCHSHLAALNNYFTAKGRDFAIMVTDSLRVKSCEPGGRYDLGGHAIEVGKDGLARLKESGTIAGSTLKMNIGLKILVENALVPFDAALGACTINPARCLRVDDRKGKLSAGYDADIVVLSNEYDVLQTYCRGTRQI